MKNSLPSYGPPDEIWDNIAHKLDQESAQRRHGRIRLLWALGAAAACVGVVIGATLWRATSMAQETLSFSAIELSAPPPILSDTLDRSYDQLLEVCEEKRDFCESPEIKQLKVELDQLTQAKNELQKALGPYYADGYLVQQLEAIERERSVLLTLLSHKIQS